MVGQRAAPARARTASGLGVGLRDPAGGRPEARVRGRAVSARVVVMRNEAASVADPHGEQETAASGLEVRHRAPAVRPHEGAAPARVASAREAPEPDAEVASAVERAASEHCPAVAVHEDPAPDRGVEVEVGGVPAAAEPAPGRRVR